MVYYRECCQQYAEPGLCFREHCDPLFVRAAQRDDVRDDDLVTALVDVVTVRVGVARVAVVVRVVVVGVVSDVVALVVEVRVVDVSGVMVDVLCCCEVSLWSMQSESVVTDSFVHCPHRVMDLHLMGSCAVAEIDRNSSVVKNSFFIFIYVF